MDRSDEIAGTLVEIRDLLREGRKSQLELPLIVLCLGAIGYLLPKLRF